MSQAAIQEFYDFTQTQPEIQSELNALLNDREAMISKAVELGEENNFSFTADELRNALAELEASQPPEGAELTDEQLEAVAGGGKGSVSAGGSYGPGGPQANIGFTYTW
jgi:predicted ribosomally synthesized peptide with nif11-like leader